MERQLICTAGTWNTSLQGQTERAGDVQLGEEKAPRRDESGMSVSKGGYKKEQTDSLAWSAVTEQGKIVSNLKRREIFRLDIGKKFFIVDLLKHWNNLTSSQMQRDFTFFHLFLQFY